MLPAPASAVRRRSLSVIRSASVSLRIEASGMENEAKALAEARRRIAELEAEIDRARSNAIDAEGQIERARVAVEDLLTACTRNRFPISPEELRVVVAQSDKQRFAFDPAGTRIRANQGHSVEIDLQLEAAEPPPVLYHGTGQQNVDAIQRSGLCRMARHHVHLSGDVETATTVGARHGKPVVFTVYCLAMRRDGFCFFRSANGVWLVDNVPPAYLGRLNET